jgi:spore coat polysaccharide biosynthesis predicted glycosyltransferase SpsG
MAKRVALVADAGREAGLGHISRSSAIAVGLRCHGVETSCYACGADAPFERDGVPWIPFDAEDISLVPGGVLVLDTYRLPQETVARTAKRSTLVLLHDLGEVPAGAALVVTVPGEPSSDGPPHMAGPAYAALRPDFWGVQERQLGYRVTRILVTTGSGQLEDIGRELAQAIAARLAPVRVTLVRGPDATATVPEGVDGLEAPDSLLEPLLQSDLVISSAGQTMLEAAAVGTPCIALPLVDNQRRQGLLLAELAAVRLVDPVTVDDVTQSALELVSDLGARLSLSRNGQRTIDGYGALRIAFEVARLEERCR